MTNSPLFGGISGLIGLLEDVEKFSGRNLGEPYTYTKTETKVPKPEDCQDSGPKYKNASDLSAGDVVILPSGGEYTIQSVSLVDGDEESVEVSFVGYETETQYPLKNWKIAVK